MTPLITAGYPRWQQRHSETSPASAWNVFSPIPGFR
jgi:hypothetical protein